MVYQGLSYGKAVPLNLAVNAKGGRDYADTTKTPPQRPEAAQAPEAPPPQGGRLFDSVVYGQEDDA